jgi:hypothetical protein
MNKPLDIKALERAMRESPNIAKHGTPDQRAGRFAPELKAKSQAPKSEPVSKKPPNC